MLAKVAMVSLFHIVSAHRSTFACKALRSLRLLDAIFLQAAVLLLAATVPAKAQAHAAPATIDVGSSPMSVAVNPVTNKTYVANLGGAWIARSEVTVIDGATGTTTAVKLGRRHLAVVVNPVTNKVYVTNRGLSGCVTEIDGTTHATATPEVFCKYPLAITVNPVTNKVYVADWASDSVLVIDAATLKPDRPFSWHDWFHGGIRQELNGQSEEFPVALSVGRAPTAVAVNSETNKVYVANEFSNTVTVIDGASNETTTVGTGENPGALAVNPATNRVYVANRGGNTVTVIDGTSNATTTVSAGKRPDGVAVNPATNRVYVANTGSNTVTVIDGATNSTTTLSVGKNPRALAVNPVTNKIYVSNERSKSVTVIDGATNATTTVRVSSDPTALAVNPVTNKVYVAHYFRDKVTVIEGDASEPTPPSVQAAGDASIR